MLRPASLSLALLAATVLFPGSAEAYVARRTDSGQPLHWDAGTITFVADASLAAIDPQALGAAVRAFATWNAVAGSGAPSVVVTEGAVDEIGYHPEGEHLNTLRYVPAGFAPARSALAITLLTFDESGKILDADIVISGGRSRGFALLPDHAPEDGESEDDEAEMKGKYDLQNVLTHEAGHVFGLAHNDADPDVTMYFSSARGETKKRDLTADDEDGLRTLYPEATALPASCAVAFAPPRGPGALGALPALLALAALRRKPR